MTVNPEVTPKWSPDGRIRRSRWRGGHCLSVEQPAAVAEVRLGHKEGGSCDPSTPARRCWKNSSSATTPRERRERICMRSSSSPYTLENHQTSWGRMISEAIRHICWSSASWQWEAWDHSVAALRFFFVGTLKRREFREEFTVSEIPSAVADGAESGRGRPAHRCRRQPPAARLADDPLRHRHAAGTESECSRCAISTAGA